MILDFLQKDNKMSMKLTCKGRLNQNKDGKVIDIRNTNAGEIVSFEVYGCYNGKEKNEQTGQYEATFQNVRVSVMKSRINQQILDGKFMADAEVIVEGDVSFGMNWSQQANRWYKNVNINFANSVNVFVTELPDSIKQRRAKQNSGQFQNNNQQQYYPQEHNSITDEHDNEDFSTIVSDEIPF